jgi:hypothetical protein
MIIIRQKLIIRQTTGQRQSISRMMMEALLFPSLTSTEHSS